MALSKGESGPGVNELQRVLNVWINRGDAPSGTLAIAEDDVYGDNTQYVVALFQKAVRLPPTGHADAATLKQLGLPADFTSNTIITEGGGI